jgi:hypothetical protein
VRLLLQQEAFGSRNGEVQEMHGGEPKESQGEIPEKGDIVSEKKIVVPEGMLQAAIHSDCMDEIENIDEEKMLEAAMRWQDGELQKLVKPSPRNECQASYNMAIDDVRRMFIAPDPEVPEDIADLVGRWGKPKDGELNEPQAELIEAYRRGQKSRS